MFGLKHTRQNLLYRHINWSGSHAAKAAGTNHDLTPLFALVTISIYQKPVLKTKVLGRSLSQEPVRSDLIVLRTEFSCLTFCLGQWKSFNKCPRANHIGQHNHVRPRSIECAPIEWDRGTVCICYRVIELLLQIISVEAGDDRKFR